jgi:hypothetical protein
MTNVAMNTRVELEAELARHEQETANAEEALGAAVLDGEGVEEVERRLSDSRAAVARLRGALGELRRRDEAEVQAKASRQRSAQLAVALEWKAEYARRSQPVLEAMDALRAAERELDEIGHCPIDANRDPEFRALMIDLLGFESAGKVASSGVRRLQTGGERDAAVAGTVSNPAQLGGYSSEAADVLTRAASRYTQLAGAAARERMPWLGGTA